MQTVSLSTATPLRATVAVVIPAYNVEVFIAAALDSVAAQTLLPCEVVVVDDGSRDASVERVRAWQAACARPFEVKLVTQDNAGASAARNLGIRNTRARWVALLDADDLWDPDHLALLLEAATVLPGIVAAYGAGRVECDGRLIEALYDDLWDNPSKALGVPLPGDAERRLRLGFGAFARLAKGNFIKPSSLLFKRDEAVAAGLFNETLRTAEDREFLVRLLRRGDFIHVPQPIATYRWHADNLTHDDNARTNCENGLKALHLIRDNEALQLSRAELQACREAIANTSASLMYMGAHEGFRSYASAIRFLHIELSWPNVLKVLSARHLFHLMRSFAAGRKKSRST